ERILDIFRGAGAEIVAEDLGTVPDFVRASLSRLGVPGCRVFRWERYWHSEGQPFRDPTDYPKTSVATSGTHDTKPRYVWGRPAPEDERRKSGGLKTIQRLGGSGDFAHLPYDARVRDTLIEALYASGSDLLLLPLGDVFGWHDRINEPGTIGEHNWSFRLPWP